MKLKPENLVIKSYKELQPGDCFVWLSGEKSALGIKMGSPEGVTSDDHQFIALGDMVGNDGNPIIVNSSLVMGLPLLHVTDARLSPSIALDDVFPGQQAGGPPHIGMLAYTNKDGPHMVVRTNNSAAKTIDVLKGKTGTPTDEMCVWFRSWRIISGEGENEITVYEHPPSRKK